MTNSDKLKVRFWKTSLPISRALEQFTTWTFTGAAAFAGLLINSLASIKDGIVPLGAIKGALFLLIVSLLAGAASKLCGVVGVATQAKMKSCAR